MKLLFFSDVHGFPEPVERMLAHAERLEPEHLILLGDILHGPRFGSPWRYDPARVAEALNLHKERIIAVRGNCDFDGDQAMFQFPLAADHAELSADGVRLFLTHGDRWNAWNLPPLPPGTVLAHGHTHIPAVKTVGGLTIFNPGSLALPRCNFPCSFGFFDGERFSVRRLSDGVVLR